MILSLKKVAKDAELVTMLVFDEVGAIVGVDERFTVRSDRRTLSHCL